MQLQQERCGGVSTSPAVLRHGCSARAAGAKARVLELLQFVRGYDREKAMSRPELVIDGRTLGFVLGTLVSPS